MKRVLPIFLILVIIFIGVWAARMRSPLTPTDPYAAGSGDDPWWVSRPNEKPTPEPEFLLDPEIPANYIPVLGRDELYMVVDEEGNIIKYRQRTKQEDGSWVWEDVDPNIPENYEKVPGLDNVYKVTEADGTVHYYKYTRNPDDTYFFTEVDENGNPLKDETPQTGDIPPNYVHVSGNIYAVYNENGVLVGYMERVDNGDGTYTWVPVNAPQSGGTGGAGNNIPDAGFEIPGVTQGQESGGNTYILPGNVTETEKGYREEETYTETREENGYLVTYETIVTREYDSSGVLVRTYRDGPNEVSRFPATEANREALRRAGGVVVSGE